MVELVYKFDRKSYCESLKRELIAKVRFNHFGPQTYIKINMDTNTNHGVTTMQHLNGRAF